AVVCAAFFNFVAAFGLGTAVAKTLGKGLIDLSIVDPTVILGGLIGAIVWDLITWWGGLPTSSSHALIGGYAGAAVAKAGLAAIRSEEHTSELQSPCNLVCRLLLEKKKKTKQSKKIKQTSLTLYRYR